MASSSHDVRFALRALYRSKGFSAAVLATMVVGIGSATAAFTLVRNVLVAPLPYPHSDRLVRVWGTDADDESYSEGLSGPDYDDLRAIHAFELLAAMRRPQMNLRPASGPAVRVEAAGCTSSLFSLLGGRAELGRLFAAGDDRPNGPRLVVLGHGLWQRAFGGDRGIVGRRITVDSQSVEVIGVLAPGTDLGTIEMWLPLPQIDPDLDARDVHNLRVYARLRPGTTLAAAQAEASALAGVVATKFPDENVGRSLRLESLRDAIVGTVGHELGLVGGVVALVLALACVNVAALWLARAQLRRGELAVRTALGAGRSRLVRLLVTETLLVGLAGAAGGLLAGRLLLRGFLALRPDTLPRVSEVHVDGGAAAFAVALALLTGVVFGTVPLLAGGLRPAALRQRGGGKEAARGARALLVVAETALALVLVAGTALLGKSLLRLTSVDPGFRADHVVSFGIELPEGRYPQPPHNEYPRWPSVVAAYDRIAERLHALPGVRAVSLAQNQPLDTGWTSTVTIAGRPVPSGTSLEETRIHIVAPGYHEMLHVPLLAGRYLTSADRPGTAEVVVVNQAFARKYFPVTPSQPRGESALGHAVDFWGRELQIVGVVGDVRFRGLDLASEPAIHPALSQNPFSEFRILVASDVAPAAVEREVRGAISELEPDVALFEVAPLSDLLAATYGERRFVATLVGGFGGLALLLAALGMSSLIAFQAAQRRRELGVRQALGARGADLLLLLAGEGSRLALAGVLLGIAGTLAVTRWLRTFLFEVTPFDPLAIGSAALLLVLVSLVAAALPAARASRLDPVLLLRDE